jgi:hypothetical protein
MSNFLFFSILVVISLDLLKMLLFRFSWLYGGHIGRPYPTGFEAHYQKMYDSIMKKTGGNNTAAESIARGYVKFSWWGSFFMRIVILFFALIVRNQWLYYGSPGTEQYDLAVKQEWICPVFVFLIWLFDFSPRLGKRLTTYLKISDFCFMLLLTAILFTAWILVK